MQIGVTLRGLCQRRSGHRRLSDARKLDQTGWGVGTDQLAAVIQTESDMNGGGVWGEVALPSSCCCEIGQREVVG